MVKFQDYYEALGVPRDASVEQIQKAFRKLAKKYHPDVNKEKSAQDKFKQINEAQEVLSDPEKRRLYDQLGPDWKSGQEFRPPPGFNAGQAGGAFRGRSSAGFDFGSGGRSFEFGGSSSGFSDFFQSFFGGGAASAESGGFENIFSGTGPRSQGTRPRRPTETELDVSLGEIYHSAKKKVSLRVTEYDEAGKPNVRTKELTVKIPGGVSSGSVIRLSGQGANGGDLLLKLRVSPDDKYRLEEAGLVAPVKIAPWEAALGASVSVDIFGDELKISIPQGIQSGQRLRLKSKGLPTSAPGVRGDAFIEILVAVPKKLSDAEKRLYEELSQISAAPSRQ